MGNLSLSLSVVQTYIMRKNFLFFCSHPCLTPLVVHIHAKTFSVKFQFSKLMTGEAKTMTRDKF